MKKSNRNGFTLIEMMVVVVIVFILSGSVIPKVMDNFARNDMINNVLEVATILRAASATARATRQEVVAEISQSNETVKTYIDYDKSASFTAGDKLLKDFTAKQPDVDITNAANDPVVLRFLPRGTIKMVTSGHFSVGVRNNTAHDDNFWRYFTATTGAMRVAVYKRYTYP